MFPHMSDSWLIILIACVIGFMIGRLIEKRRNKDEKNNDYVNGLKKRLLAETADQKKRIKRKPEGPIKRAADRKKRIIKHR